ncbi:hypothetical protein F5Y13DRAFT_65058 [Hypoxylon sp. FL1857]|nr:hypothetical protein F5Y13DRAFT_65058 [Hypoxylon sp. FL1857]
MVIISILLSTPNACLGIRLVLLEIAHVLQRIFYSVCFNFNFFLFLFVMHMREEGMGMGMGDACVRGMLPTSHYRRTLGTCN